MNTVMALLLFLAFALPAASGSEGIAAQSSSSPLYEYRYNQALEGIGFVDQGTTESKMCYGCISKSNLNPRDAALKDAAYQNKPIRQDTSEVTCQYTCQRTCFDTCEKDTCAARKIYLRMSQSKAT